MPDNHSAASKLPPGSPAGETASAKYAMGNGICECGHLMAWHSLTSAVYVPAASGCLAECNEGGSKCPCTAFRPVAVPEPVPTEGVGKEYPESAHEWLQDALGRFQVTHIHSSIREALKAMDLTESTPSAPEAAAADFKHDPDCPCFSEQHSVDCANCECQCRRPPKGWRCTRGYGHNGPCAALPVDESAAPIAPAAEEVIQEPRMPEPAAAQESTEAIPHRVKWALQRIMDRLGGNDSDKQPVLNDLMDVWDHHSILPAASPVAGVSAEKPEVDWDERYRTMPPTKCACGLKDIPAAIDGVQWYWQRHSRTGCTLELPNLTCWCGLKRSEHIDGHADPIVAQPSAEGDGWIAVQAENERLKSYLNTPETNDFFAGIEAEAAHQRYRWPSENDAGKAPADWFWLVGYLAGKCLASHIAGNTEKALHHTISTAAALANWHRAIKGAGNMRPGTETPSEALPAAPVAKEGRES